jgi:phage portal protein BeeE
MEYSQSMINAARWICGAYNVPPQLIGLPGESTFANMEQAMTWFWTNTVLPLTDKIYSRLSNWLLPAYGDKTAYLVVDHDDLPALEPMRREKSDRINGATFMTINEKRINMGLPPIEEGGDTVLVPAGNVPISMVGEIGLMDPGATGTP